MAMKSGLERTGYPPQAIKSIPYSLPNPSILANRAVYDRRECCSGRLRLTESIGQRMHLIVGGFFDMKRRPILAIALFLGFGTAVLVDGPIAQAQTSPPTTL